MTLPTPTAPASWSERVQGAMLRGAVACLRGLGPVGASNLGGWLGRQIGPLLPVSSVADRNLQDALPALDRTERRHVIRGVWDNLGRNAAELCHVTSLRRTVDGPGWEIDGEEHATAPGSCNGQAVFFSGHLGNWEMILPIAGALGLPVAGFYRTASNQTVDALIQSLRRPATGNTARMFPKGAHGARMALHHVRDGGSLGFLVDQKMNDGISVAFFGRDAMTAPAAAQIAVRHGLPVIPVRVDRLGAARFRLVCEPPLVVVRTGDRQADVHAITLLMNVTLERWIRRSPENWLWLHRRWPKQASVSESHR